MNKIQNYNSGKFLVYALWSFKTEKVYIGSTTLFLNRRYNLHKAQFHRNHQLAHKNIINDGLDITDFHICEIGEYNTKREMLDAEKDHMYNWLDNGGLLFNFRDGTKFFTEKSLLLRKQQLGPYFGKKEYAFNYGTSRTRREKDYNTEEYKQECKLAGIEL